MPTPSPTIAAVGGAQSGTATTRLSTAPSASAVPRPNTAVISGRPMATAEPKVTSRMSAAAMQPDALGAERCRLGERRDRAADLDLEGVVPGGEDRVDQGLRLRRGEVAVPLVEGDHGVGGGAVLGDLRRARVGERAGHGDHVVGSPPRRRRSPPPSCGLGRRDTGLGVDHDLHGVTGGLRERRLEGVGGGLRLRPRLQVVLPGLAAEASARAMEPSRATIQAATTRRRLR